MAQSTIKPFEKLITFLSPTGWFIETKLSLKTGESVVSKTLEFTNLNDLPQDVQDGLKSGELTIKRQ